MQERSQSMQLEQNATPSRRDKQSQLLLQTVPNQLHGLLFAPVIQLKPRADLQITAPGHHGGRRHRATVGHNLQVITFMPGQITQSLLVQLDIGDVGQHLVQSVQTLGHGLQVRGRNRGGPGRERCSQSRIQ